MPCRVHPGPSWWIYSLLAAAAVLSACGGGDGAAPPTDDPEPLVRAVIGPAGGELAHPDIVLGVPAGALDEATEIVIHAVPALHPFGQSGASTYRIEGLPFLLHAPLALRMRTGMARAPGDSIAVFRGEPREGFEFARELSWEPVASRDSSGWQLAEVARGALPLGGKAEGHVHVATAAQIGVLVHEGGHYRIVYERTEVTDEDAAGVLTAFEYQHVANEGLGFSFGDFPDIWPLDVIVRDVDFSSFCYVTAPRGAGHFILDPAWAPAGTALAPVIAHEVLHCAQTFYDPRAPELWGSLNRERLWLDEATAAYVETITSGAEGYVPMGLSFDFLLAPLAGVDGHPSLAEPEYGYGMSSLIAYLCEDPLSGQDDGRLHQLYESFAVHGSVKDALAAVVDPPIANWCVDFHRKLVEGEIYLPDGATATWHWLPIDGTLASATGTSIDVVRTVPALGGVLARFPFATAPPAENSSLVVEVEPLAPARAPETGAHVTQPATTVYGRRAGEIPERVRIGTGRITIADFRALHERFDELIVLVSWPVSAATQARIEVEVDDDDLHRVFGLSRIDAVLSNVSRVLVCEGTQCPYPSRTTSEAMWVRDIEGTWNGTTFSATWQRSFPAGSPYGGERTERGALELTMSEDGSAVLGFSAHQEILVANGDAHTFGWARATPGDPVPEDADVFGYEVGYRLVGSSVCTGLSVDENLTYEVLDVTETLQSHACPGTGATLGIFFEAEDPARR